MLTGCLHNFRNAARPCHSLVQQDLPSRLGGGTRFLRQSTSAASSSWTRRTTPDACQIFAQAQPCEGSKRSCGQRNGVRCTATFLLKLRQYYTVLHRPSLLAKGRPRKPPAAQTAVTQQGLWCSSVKILTDNNRVEQIFASLRAAELHRLQNRSTRSAHSQTFLQFRCLELTSLMCIMGFVASHLAGITE